LFSYEFPDGHAKVEDGAVVDVVVVAVADSVAERSVRIALVVPDLKGGGLADILIMDILFNDDRKDTDVYLEEVKSLQSVFLSLLSTVDEAPPNENCRMSMCNYISMNINISSKPLVGF
jgi:hypothetical protein